MEADDQSQSSTPHVTITYPGEVDAVFDADCYSISRRSDGLDLLFGITAPNGRAYDLYHVRLLNTCLLTSAVRGREQFWNTLREYRVGTAPRVDLAAELDHEDVGLESRLANSVQFAVTLFGGGASFSLVDPFDVALGGADAVIESHPVVRVLMAPESFAHFYADLLEAADAARVEIEAAHPFLLKQAEGLVEVPLSGGGETDEE